KALSRSSIVCCCATAVLDLAPPAPVDAPEDSSGALEQDLHSQTWRRKLQRCMCLLLWVLTKRIQQYLATNTGSCSAVPLCLHTNICHANQQHGHIAGFGNPLCHLHTNALQQRHNAFTHKKKARHVLTSTQCQNSGLTLLAISYNDLKYGNSEAQQRWCLC
ncbi:hypothetical protein COO60DRAFT_1530120, partial [Scenedesmus sp. NREL 46B-D3]